jgi:hypothetical protein
MKTIWNDIKHPSWGALAIRTEPFVEKLTEREDIAVLVAPDTRKQDEKDASPVPAGVFYPGFARMNLNASLIFDETLTDDELWAIDPNGVTTQDAYPALVGTLVHESAHAKYSSWDVPKGVDERLFYWVKLLEETRAERKILKDFPQYTDFIKTILTDIVFEDIGGQHEGRIYDRYSAAHSALLVLARVSIDVITLPEVQSVQDAVVGILGTKDYYNLRNLWVEGQNINDDSDFDAILAVAEKIQKLVDPNNEADDFDISMRMPCGAFAPEGSGDSGSGDGDSEGKGKDSKGEKGSGKGSDDASSDEDGEDEDEAPDAGMGAQKQNLKDAIDGIQITVDVAPTEAPAPKTAREKEKARKQDVKGAAGKIQDASTTSNSGYGYGSWSRTPVKKTSTPNAVDVSRMRAIMNALSQAQYRDVTKTIHPSELPPGRLVMREAMNRDGQVASRQNVTAQPWRQTRRREVDNPPITLAVSTDISGSMSSWQREVASFTWAVSSAVKNLQGRVGAVAWDTATYAWISPNSFSKDLTTFSCNGGSSGCPESIKSLDGLMDLSYSEGVRILAVITDGELGGSVTAIQKEITFLANQGVIVLWLLTSNSSYAFKPKNAQVAVMKKPEDFGKIVGKTMVEALAKA